MSKSTIAVFAGPLRCCLSAQVKGSYFRRGKPSVEVIDKSTYAAFDSCHFRRYICPFAKRFITNIRLCILRYNVLLYHYKILF